MQRVHPNELSRVEDVDAGGLVGWRVEVRNGVDAASPTGLDGKRGVVLSWLYPERKIKKYSVELDDERTVEVHTEQLRKLEPKQGGLMNQVVVVYGEDKKEAQVPFGGVEEK